ncbi:MAG: cytochrome b N-terminal domain-containing protein, partial [Deltaproteobacteria bacterium]|nr:cytochrome b N-terminal domain-containing protein [Deltaproteobacteria bacterium]
MRKVINFFRHIHPPFVRERIFHPLTTLGLGVVCFTCLLLLIATGVSLLLYYVPHQDLAYDRILHIITALKYGRLLRTLHYLAANLLLIAGILHMARVFFMGSYQGRRLNWIYGLFLLSLIFLSNYTGYLLPWDQTSYWAAKVGSNLIGYLPEIGSPLKSFMLGGEDIGEETLIRAFAFHIAVLPSLWVIFTSLHLWRVRKDGGLAFSEEKDEAVRVPSSPWLFRAELSVVFLTISLLLILSFFVDVPLSGRADPLHPPTPAKAPWYFVGIQEMVSHSAILGGVAAPLLIVLFLLLTPFLDRSEKTAGRWFARSRWFFNSAFTLIVLSQVAMIIIGQWF